MKPVSWHFRIYILIPVLFSPILGLGFNLHLLSADPQVDTRNLRAKQADNLVAWPVNSKRWAVVIGVSQYKDKQISQLNGASNDASLLAAALVQYAGFPADQVILLATDQPEERQPTRVNVLRSLSNILALVPKDGLFLFFFAGHGLERRGLPYLLRNSKSKALV